MITCSSSDERIFICSSASSRNAPFILSTKFCAKKTSLGFLGFKQETGFTKSFFVFLIRCISPDSKSDSLIVILWRRDFSPHHSINDSISSIPSLESKWFVQGSQFPFLRIATNDMTLIPEFPSNIISIFNSTPQSLRVYFEHLHNLTSF